MIRCWQGVLALGFFCLLTLRLQAGGSGLNVIVVVNQSSSNSVQLGNYYCEKRQVPPQNVLRINWPGGMVDWSVSDFESYLLSPFSAMLSSRQLTNQIDYVVLSMDIPYRVYGFGPHPHNSTTSALFYGFKNDTDTNACSLPVASTSLYAGSEGIFRATPPISAASNSFLVTMLTASNLAKAKQIVDNAVLSDSTFPTQTVWLAKSTDWARNVRYATFDNAIFNTRLRGNFSMARTNQDSFWVFGNILGLQQGFLNGGLEPTTFVPGSLADNLTSYGGQIFEPSGHVNILQFLEAGAAGSYGTVDEPCNYLEKFPSPQNYFYQARGFSVGECYYMSVTNPYQGLVVGEPLAAPFAVRPTGAFNSLPTNALLAGSTNLTLQFNANDPVHPVHQVDLFVDGLWQQTLTNISPTRSNLLNVTIHGQSMNYLVPLNASVKLVANGVASVLNTFSGATKVFAFAHGDRIELQSNDQAKTGLQISLSVSNSIGAGSARTTFLFASRTNFLDTIGNGIRSFWVYGVPTNDTFVQLVATKTNGAQETFSVTNNGSQTLAEMVQQLITLINTRPSLQGADGLIAEDFVDYAPGASAAQFNLRARSIGWASAQIQVDLSSSPVFTNSSTGNVKLDENLGDLRPRTHLYVTAGVTNLPITFGFNTFTQANGFHELTAVVYEGSHVHTQKRISQSVRIQNDPLSASFTIVPGSTNAAVEGTLQFSITANTNNIAKIELFSTGGSLTNLASQASAVFPVAGTNLGVGLHPFYAIVTSNNGKQYRTETKWIRLVGPDSPFLLSISAAKSLSWPTTPGRRYEILWTTNSGNGFQVEDTLTASNAAAQWTGTNPGPQRFYRVRTAE